MAVLLALWSKVPSWARQGLVYLALVLGIFLFGYREGYSHVKTVYIQQEQKQEIIHDKQIIKAEDTKQSEDKNLGEFIHSKPIVVRLCNNSAVQAPTPAKAGAGSTPSVGEQVHEGDSGLQPGPEGRDVGDLLNAFGALFDHTNSNLREQQSVNQ